MSRLYYDHNATAPLAKGLKDQLTNWCDALLGNPSSVHQEGQTARALVEKSRKKIKELLGVPKGAQLYFTSGASEANNWAVQSAYAKRGSKTRILLSTTEHSCVLEAVQALAKKDPTIELSWVRVSPAGEIDLQDYNSKLDDSVFLVSVMLASNETGFIYPIKEMAQAAQEKNIAFLCDAVCVAGKQELSFTDLGVSHLSFSSHKFGGLKGVGGLIVDSSTRLEPFVYGGGQEQGKRSGTENGLGIASSAYALEVALSKNKTTDYAQRRAALKTGISELYPDAYFIESQRQLPQTLCVSFLGLNGHLLLTNLDLEGVAVSYGSACASGSLEESRVLKALGLTIEQARGAIRISFGSDTNQNDDQEFLKRLKNVLGRMAKA